MRKKTPPKVTTEQQPNEALSVQMPSSVAFDDTYYTIECATGAMPFAAEKLVFFFSLQIHP